MRRYRFVLFFSTFFCVGLLSTHAAQAADRYWVGGAASWDGTAGSKWDTVSGGSGGSAVPTSSDACFFDAASGAVTITIASGNTGCGSLDFTGFTGTLAGSTAITISGNVTYGSGMTRSYTGIMTIDANSNITSNGSTGAGALTINGSGITVTFKDDYTSTGYLTLTQGTLDASDSGANHNVTVGGMSTSSASTRTLTMGDGLWSITSNDTDLGASTLTMDNATNLTFNRGAQPFTFTYSGANGRAIGGTQTAATCDNAPDIHVAAGSGRIDMVGNGGIRVYGNLDFTGTTGQLFNQSSGRAVCGDITLDPGMTVAVQTNGFLWEPPLGHTATLTTNGVTMDVFFAFCGAGTMDLADDLYGTTTTSFFTFGFTAGCLSLGTLNLNGHTITGQGVQFLYATSGTINMGSGTIVAKDFYAPSSGVTFNAGTSTITLSASNASFSGLGGGHAYHNLTITGSATAVAMAASTSDTFDSISIDADQARTITMSTGTSNGLTVGTLTATGTSTNTITLQGDSDAGDKQWTLTKTGGGTFSGGYLSIASSSATPASTWYAGTTSTDLGDNTGWTFTDVPGSGASRHPEDFATPTPEPAPSPTPEVTPSPTPTVSPTPSPTPTPTPAPSPSLITTPPPDLPPPAPAGALGPLERTVKLGEQGLDIRRIQQLLNAQGFIVNPIPGGPGSPGYETDKYGYATRFAVQRFQQAHVAELIWPFHLTAPSGVVDALTAKLLGY